MSIVPLWLRLVVLGAIVLALVGMLKGCHDSLIRQGYDKRAAEDKAAADAQAERNRELQRAAEKRYVVQAATRDRFFTQTMTEVRHEAAPLASCPLPPGVVRVLNRAAECARSDSASACGSTDAVPDTR